MKKVNLLKVIEAGSFESLIEDVSNLHTTYNGIYEWVYFYEEIKYQKLFIKIEGKVLVEVNGRTINYLNSPSEFWETSKTVNVEFKEIEVYKGNEKIDCEFLLEIPAKQTLEKFIKNYI